MAETSPPLTTHATTRPDEVEADPGTTSRAAMPEAEPVRRRRFTVEEFERMAEVGILADDERVELIGGEIFVMSRIGSPHAACVSRCSVRFSPLQGTRALVRIQDPIRLGQGDELEPDVALARLREDFYQSGHPTPADLYLVIEVMDSSASHDRNVKLPLYAGAGIPEVWLIDLPGAVVEVHRRPLDGRYAEKSTYTRGQSVSPEAFPDVVLAVDALLNRPQEPS